MGAGSDAIPLTKRSFQAAPAAEVAVDLDELYNPDFGAFFIDDVTLSVQPQEPLAQLDYPVSRSTNFAGVTLPTQFFMAQYQPNGFGSSMLAFVAKGQVLSIAPARERTAKLEPNHE